MPMNRLRHTVGALTILLAAHAAQASDLYITAQYQGSVTQNSGQFTNTTQGTGTCTEHPEYCPAGYFSLLFPWAGNQQGSTMGTKQVVAPSSDPRDGFYLGFDASERTITVTNLQGKTHMLSLAIDAIGFGMTPNMFHSDLYYPRGTNCKNVSIPYGGTWVYGMWGARSHAFTECYLPFPEGSSTEQLSLGYLNFRYQLKMDAPWAWEPGVYHGSYTYRIGQGKDLDFGNNFSGSADDVTLHFELTVRPDMYVSFHASKGATLHADLQPPSGWSKWQHKTPPYLSKELTFDFGSTGPVSISLVCEHAVGDGCGIVDLQGGSPLGVDTLLTANYFNDDSGKEAIASRLSTSGRIFAPVTAGHPRVHPAKLLFKTLDGVTPQLQSGHQYGGRVTVVFDSELD